MTDEQWQALIDVIGGDLMDPPPVAFIIDSPWLPGWAGMSLMDYYTSEPMWFEANLKAIQRFEGIMFLPGFWAEWGMCTEPSAFGAKCVWQEDEFPFADKITESVEALASAPTPDPRTHGLAPFVLKRLAHFEQRIQEVGHAIRFAVARGPLNIAAFLLGTTAFFTGLRRQPDAAHAVLRKVTDFLVHWLQLQATTFRSIDGVLILDDLVGFCGKKDFEEFAKPYLTEVFGALDVAVRFFHNDAAGLVCAPALPDIGVNLFNFSFNHTMAEIRALTQNRVTLLGNLPPRDVLAQGTPEDVQRHVTALLESLDDRSRVILSCGGGMPPAVSTENIEAFLRAAGHVP